MAIICFSIVGILAMAVCVLKKIVYKVGFFECRFANDKTFFSDLCFASAKRLTADNNINHMQNDVVSSKILCDKDRFNSLYHVNTEIGIIDGLGKDGIRKYFLKLLARGIMKPVFQIT